MTSQIIRTLLTATVLVTAAFGQEKPTFRLDFRIQEAGTAGTPANTTRYSLIVQNGARGKINASRRIPYYTNSKGEAKELHTAALGSIIECTPEQTEGALRLACAVESSFVEPGQTGRPIPLGFLPVVTSRQVSTTAAVVFGTEVQLASLDDPGSRNRVEVFVKAERIRP